MSGMTEIDPNAVLESLLAKGGQARAAPRPSAGAFHATAWPAESHLSSRMDYLAP